MCMYMCVCVCVCICVSVCMCEIIFYGAAFLHVLLLSHAMVSSSPQSHYSKAGGSAPAVARPQRELTDREQSENRELTEPNHTALTPSSVVVFFVVFFGSHLTPMFSFSGFYCGGFRCLTGPDSTRTAHSSSTTSLKSPLLR